MVEEGQTDLHTAKVIIEILKILMVEDIVKITTMLADHQAIKGIKTPIVEKIAEIGINIYLITITCYLSTYLQRKLYIYLYTFVCILYFICILGDASLVQVVAIAVDPEVDLEVAIDFIVMDLNNLQQEMRLLLELIQKI